MYKTSNPVLIIVFNRPEKTKIVFGALRTVKPSRLYIAADAPRLNKPNEKIKCQETLEVFKGVDWPCETFIKVNPHNLGSHTSIPQAIDWFFENEKAGIVLEDDCLPNESFFKYCDALLDKYQEDERIMWINGSNGGFTTETDSPSYYYSIYPISWGWASWRRAWRNYDDFRFSLPNGISSDILKKHFGNSIIKRLFWKATFSYAYAIKNWDYRWVYAMWISGGLACTPSVNLISNIGFGDDGMHCQNKNDDRANLPVGEIGVPLSSPKFCDPFKKLDGFLSKKLYQIKLKNYLKVCLVARAPRIRDLFRRIRNKPV